VIFISSGHRVGSSSRRSLRARGGSPDERVHLHIFLSFFGPQLKKREGAKRGAADHRDLAERVLRAKVENDAAYNRGDRLFRPKRGQVADVSDKQ